jgi:heat shock protein HslJ
MVSPRLARLCAILALQALACGQRPPPAPEVPGVDLSKTAERIQGIWELEAIDGVRQLGYLSFGRKGQLDFSAGCNSSYGVYSIRGDRVAFEFQATTLMECDNVDGPNYSAPSFLDAGFRVLVNDETLVVLALDTKSRERWASYRRSSVETIYRRQRSEHP